MYTCFVIGPFGDENGGRKDFALHLEREGLKQRIFTRAAEFCKDDGYPVSIAYADHGPQSMRSVGEDTAMRIDRADVVILVATSATKPNTWIELGWADAFWHVPIFLIRKGFRLPVDINNPISVFYNSKQVGGDDVEGANGVARRLADRIIERIAAPNRKKRFAHLKETISSIGNIRVYERFSNALSFNEWSEMLQGAAEEIRIASPRMLDILSRNFSWAARGATPQMAPGESARQPIQIQKLLLRKALDDKVRVTILMQHPDNYSVDHSIRNPVQSADEVRADLQRSYDIWAQTVLDYRQGRQSAEITGGESFPTSAEEGFRVIQIHRRFLPYRVTLTEKRAVTTLRFHTESVNSGLCIDSRPATEDYDVYIRPFYEQIKEELDFLIAENEKHAEPNYQDFLTRRRQAGT